MTTRKGSPISKNPVQNVEDNVSTKYGSVQEAQNEAPSSGETDDMNSEKNDNSGGNKGCDTDVSLTMTTRKGSPLSKNPMQHVEDKDSIGESGNTVKKKGKKRYKYRPIQCGSVQEAQNEAPSSGETDDINSEKNDNSGGNKGCDTDVSLTMTTRKGSPLSKNPMQFVEDKDSIGESGNTVKKKGKKRYKYRPIQCGSVQEAQNEAPSSGETDDINSEKNDNSGGNKGCDTDVSLTMTTRKGSPLSKNPMQFVEDKDSIGESGNTVKKKGKKRYKYRPIQCGSGQETQNEAPSSGEADDMNSDKNDNSGGNNECDTGNDIIGPAIVTKSNMPVTDRERPTFYEESRDMYYGNKSVITKNTLDTYILIHGIDLGDEFTNSTISTVSNGKDFYKDIHDTEQLAEIGDLSPFEHKKCTIQIEAPHLAVCKPIHLDDQTGEILIHGRSKCGRAFTDDVVLVRLLSGKSMSQKRERKETDTNCDKVYGEVIGVLERTRFKDIQHPVFVCVIDEHEGHLMKPLCKTIPKINVNHSKVNQKVNKTYRKNKIQLYQYDKVSRKLQFKEIMNLDPAERQKYIFLVVFLTWNSRCIYPRGAVIGVRLPDQDLGTGLEIVGLQQQVPSVYKKDTVDSVTKLLQRMPNGEISSDLTVGREDLSEILDAFTIDPSGARDLDDALSLQSTKESFRVGVHIADVASFVEKGSSIDKEAFERAFTYYPGQDFRPFRMLPEPLSDDLCSLIPGKKRLTLSVFFEFDTSGNVIGKPEIKKTIVKSVRQFTYKEAWNIIADAEKRDKLSMDIKNLHQLALKIRRSRLQDAIHALPVELDVEDEDDSVLATLEAHWLVEEFMIKTNQHIGEFLASKVSTIIRCQKPPSEGQMKTWAERHKYIADIIFHLQNKRISSERELKIENAPTDKYSNLIALQHWVWCGINEAMENENPIGAWNLMKKDKLHPEQCLVYEEWIKFQETAEYRSSGCLYTDEQSNGHFSLGMCNYTHFTSPIRRYPDLVVHRQLHAFLDDKESVYQKDEITEICSHINPISKNVSEFGKQCKVLQLAHDLKKTPQYAHGMVQEVTDSEVVLYFPGMCIVPKRHRTIQFSLLDVSSKPILESNNDLARSDELDNRDRVVVKWQKRLYRNSGFHENTRRQNDKCFQIDPHQKTTFMRYKDWVLMLETVLNNDPKELREVYDSIKDDVNSEAFRDNINSCRVGVKDVSSEVNKGLITKHRCEFILPIHINQIVGVQFSAEPKNGLLVPSPQIVDITNNFKCCLEHTDDPVRTLVEYATVRTKQTYRSLNEYIDIWLPIIKMESATNAVRNEDSITIGNIPIEFTGRQGRISHTASYFDLRDIDFDAMSFDFLKENTDDCKQASRDEGKKSASFVTMGSSDYVCIRCCYLSTKKDRISQKINGHPDKENIWIGHGEVTKVKKTEKRKVHVIFNLHSRCSDPPQRFLKTTDNVTLEIIQKSKVDKRTETYLKMLEKASPTAQAIALGKSLPKLGACHLKIVGMVKREVPLLSPNNAEQLEAIDRALKTRLSLIQGPPGTGKTYTGLKLICIFNKFNRLFWEQTKGDRKQIVFCGPSNKSVDHVAKLMNEKLKTYAPKMLRMYGKAFENMEFPIPGRARASSRTMRGSKVDEYLSEKDLVLHRLIRNPDKPLSAKLRYFDAKFKGSPENITLEDIKKYNQVLREAKELELKNVDVIFCTTSVAASPKFIEATKGRIYQCIIDECGMCTEPESMVPIIGTKAEQVVLIGDHKQLRPVVLCRAAVELGLEKSLFERYACLKRHLTMLTKQYRMNPYICEFPSKTFYDKKLITVPSICWMEPNPLNIWTRLVMKMDDPVRGHMPHIFCNIEGEENVLTVSTEEGNEQSRSNMKEVEHVVRVFRYMVEVEKVNKKYINVISQYNAQCHALKTAFQREKLPNLNINTVVASQGNEWDYVIFSTVRSLPAFLIESNPTEGWCKKNLGFITDHHQINVAITRARKGLIIIGNQNLLRCDRVWRQLIQYYQSCDCLKTADNFPPRIESAKHLKSSRSTHKRK